ncbi:unnamed protein product, partial [Scytosiphon promiscuus]
MCSNRVIAGTPFTQICMWPHEEHPAGDRRHMGVSYDVHSKRVFSLWRKQENSRAAVAASRFLLVDVLRRSGTGIPVHLVTTINTVRSYPDAVTISAIELHDCFSRISNSWMPIVYLDSTARPCTSPLVESIVPTCFPPWVPVSV